MDLREIWRVHSGTPHPFNAPAPRIDNGTARLTPERYTSRVHAEREWEQVFARTWLLACPSSDVREPGDFARFDIGRESFVVARSDDGQLYAHYNVCPHRGSRLVLGDNGSLSGFTCPFHSWRFGLDGRNLAVTDAETFRPEVLCHGNDLTSVRCEEAAGLVFVSMDPGITPLAQWLGPILEQLELYDIGRMNAVQHRRSEWGANWKGGVDAFAETYHLHAVHPQTQCLMDDRTEIDLWPGGFSRQVVPLRSALAALPRPDERQPRDRPPAARRRAGPRQVRGHSRRYPRRRPGCQARPRRRDRAGLEQVQRFAAERFDDLQRVPQRPDRLPSRGGVPPPFPAAPRPIPSASPTTR